MVLVGQSIGKFYATLYGGKRLDEVAGLVLIEHVYEVAHIRPAEVRQA